MNLIKLNNNQDNNYGKELTDEEKQQRLLSILNQTKIKDTAICTKHAPWLHPISNITLSFKLYFPTLTRAFKRLKQFRCPLKISKPLFVADGNFQV